MSYKPFSAFVLPSLFTRPSATTATTMIKATGSSAYSTSLSKPLTRASINRQKVQKVIQQKQQRQQQKRYIFTSYYYRFPKIPRPKRNHLYYNVTGISIVGTIRKRFSTGPLAPIRKYKNGNFIANSKKLFGRRRYSTTSQTSGSTTNGEQRISKRKRLRNWFTLTSISIIFFGVYSRYQSGQIEEVDDEEEVIRPTSLGLYMYQRLPLNTISRLWGQVNNIDLPIWLRGPGYRFYSKLFGVKLDEMEDPDLTHYKNLGEFFYRSIKLDTRPLDQTALLNSPCDGRVLKFGVVENGQIEQVKGMTYKVDALLGKIDSKKLAAPVYQIEFSDSDKANEEEFLQKMNSQGHTLIKYQGEGDKTLIHPSLSQVMNLQQSLKVHQDSPSSSNGNKLYFTVIYLAPGDYHKFHSPVNWVTTLRRHFVGELYSVAPYFQRTFNNLFVLNERVALLGYWKYGFFSMTPVGATNVGSIKVNFDKDLTTNEVYEHELYSTTDLTTVATTSTESSISSISSKRTKKNTCYEATYSNASHVLGGQPLLKGEEVGGFKLGSTVVLCFEAPANFKFNLNEGQYVKLGQGIGYLESESN